MPWLVIDSVRRLKGRPASFPLKGCRTLQVTMQMRAYLYRRCIVAAYTLLQRSLHRCCSVASY